MQGISNELTTIEDNDGKKEAQGIGQPMTHFVSQFQPWSSSKRPKPSSARWTATARRSGV